MSKTLCISDLDGTLLNKESKVNKFSEEIINKLIIQGMNFSIATARSWSSASKVLQNLNITLPVVTYNGAFIVDPKSGDIIQSCCFEKEQSDYIFSVFNNAKIYPLVYGFIDNEEKVSWIGGKENEGMLYYLNLRKGDKRLRMVNLAKNLSQGNIFYFTAIGSKGELEPLIQHFSDERYFSCTFQQELYREEYWLEIKRFDATKSTGIEKVKLMTGCSKVISFGDGINDLPMFSISDEAYAVSNANPQLIKVATSVIDNADENAVAKWLHENAHRLI